MIHFPSGDQNGQDFAAGSVVNWRRSEPSAFATQICPVPEVTDVKATRAASNDNDACVIVPPCRKVICRGSAERSKGMDQRLRSPVAGLLNNIVPLCGIWIHIGCQELPSTGTADAAFVAGSPLRAALHTS